MNRRQKARNEARRQQARRWAKEAEQANLPLPLQQASKANLAGKQVLLVCRVSCSKQQSDLVGQILYLTQQAKSYEADIAGVYAYVANGADESRWQAVAQRARELEVDAILWESTCRAIRHPDWGRDKSLEPTNQQVERFTEIYQGFELFTCLDPDADLFAVRKHQTQRGLKMKCVTGRGNRSRQHIYQTNRKIALFPLVVNMRKIGLSLGQIAKDLGLTRRLIDWWLQGR